MSISVAILKSESKTDHLEWVRACESFEEIDYRCIELTGSDWLEQVSRSDIDVFLTRPPDQVGYYKQMYDERLLVIDQMLERPIYPTLTENLIYENKRMLAYWLQANDIPHPETRLFYDREEAYDFADRCDLPIVSKTAIGASGSGVKIHRKRGELRRYLQQAFEGQGIGRTWGPNLRRGNLADRAIKRLRQPVETLRYLSSKRERAVGDRQKGYVILQEYIPCDFEWRCVNVGGSYFGHKKIRTYGDLMSGTSAVAWDVPPEPLLDFVKMACDKGSFTSQAVDIFQRPDGSYVVNEMQCFFGSKNPHQMLRNGIPGRFVRQADRWIFEEGEFNTNNSFNLRISHVIERLRQRESDGTH